MLAYPVSRLPQLEQDRDDLEAELLAAQEDKERAAAADGALEAQREKARGAEVAAREALKRLQEELDGLRIFAPVGCNQCTDGYKGRVGIFQVMPVSEETGRIIMEGGNAMQIADQAAREGVLDLRASGLQKVRDGVTSLEEVNRVTID